MFLIAANFIILSLIFLNKGSRYIDSFIKSALIMGGLIVAYNEIASIFHSLNDVTCLGFWGVVLMSIVLYVNKNKILLSLPKLESEKIKEFKKTPMLIMISVLFAIIALVTLFTALYYPPNTSDSMVYHMPKVMQWIQNQSVMHFPTNSIRQLYLAPFAEYVVLHFQLLSNTDYFANLLQWLSFIGCILLSFEITRLLGGGLRAQFYALILTATIPMAILQSTGTQTDLVVSFFIAGVIYFMLKIIETKNTKNVIFLALSIALAILTKGTAYFFLCPFILLFGFKLLKERDLKSILIITLIVFLINLAHWARNYSLFNTILVPKSHAMNYQIQTLKPNYVFVNLLRNITINTAIPNSTIINGQVKAVEKLEKYLKTDSNSTLTTFPNTEFQLYPLTTNELTTGNFTHFLFFVIAILLIPLVPTLRGNKKVLTYTSCSILGLILFSTAMKWQPWASRLILPFFVLIVPYLSIFFAQERLKVFSNIVLFIFLYFSLAPLFLNGLRPVLVAEAYQSDRFAKLFHNRWYKFEDYKKISSELPKIKPHNIGLIAGDDSYEYPLWVIIKGSRVRIQHQNIENESKILLTKKPFNSFRPDIILDLR